MKRPPAREKSADIVGPDDCRLEHGALHAGRGLGHTTRDLARLLGFAYVFGTESVELRSGDEHETSLFARVPNRHGLHGNAILSRYPPQTPALIPVEDGGSWFTANPKNDGHLRISGRMAIAARVETTAEPVTFAAVHYESDTHADGRADRRDRPVTRQ